jgi:membrane protein
LRVYLHFFNSFSITYGSLGAVIILLTWFYLTGLMLLTGAEINSEIEAAAAERRVSEITPLSSSGIRVVERPAASSTVSDSPAGASPVFRVSGTSAITRSVK